MGGDAISQEEGKFRVELMRDKLGFGFSLCGGAECNSPLYVLDIIRGGAAEKDGRLRVSGNLGNGKERVGMTLDLKVITVV